MPTVTISEAQNAETLNLTGNQWTNSLNACVTDGVFATCANTDGTGCDIITLAGWDLAGLPDGAIILGMAVRVRASCTVAEAAGGSIRIYKDGNFVGTSHSIGIDNTLTDKTVGGGTDLWGVALTRDYMDSGGFTIAVSYDNVAEAAVVSLDGLSITLTYQMPSNAPRNRQAMGTNRRGMGRSAP